MFLAALVAAFVVTGVVAQARTQHLPGCHSARCDRSARVACQHHFACRARVQRKAWHRTADPYWGIFVAISYCESHGHWNTETGNGFYGGVQFALPSWYAVGGRGDPARASQLEQIYRAVLLMRRQGYGAWPVCRHSAGV